MKADHLLKVVDLSQLLLNEGPLALNDRNRDILVDRLQEVAHLLPEELQLAQLPEVLGRNPLRYKINKHVSHCSIECLTYPELGLVELLPEQCEAVDGPLKLQQEEEHRVVLH